MAHAILPADPGLTSSQVSLCSGESHQHISEISEYTWVCAGQRMLRPVLALSVIMGSDVRTAGKQRGHGEEAGKGGNSSLKPSAKAKIFSFQCYSKENPCFLQHLLSGRTRRYLALVLST